MTGKFQEYDSDFGLMPWTRGNADEIPIENITTPIAYYFGGEDDLCVPRLQYKYIDRIPSSGERYYIPNMDHEDLTGHNHEDFMRKIFEQLDAPMPELAIEPEILE